MSRAGKHVTGVKGGKTITVKLIPSTELQLVPNAGKRVSGARRVKMRDNTRLVLISFRSQVA